MKNIDSAQAQIPHNQRQKDNSAKFSLLSGSPQKNGTKRVLKKISALLALVIVILGSVVVFRAINLSDKIFVGKKLSFFQKLREVLAGSAGQINLIGQDSGQINVLLLGIGGEGHDGPYLTDTMILAQIRPDKNQAALISIPRDYWVNIPGYGDGKINEAFSDGYIKNHDWAQGGQLAMRTVSSISGLDIPYFAVVDFSGFEKAVNQVGGLDVKIDRAFTDYSFPNDATNGYLPPVNFAGGWEHMNGARALTFARSRHAAGPEGSDFARSQRQQKIIDAFKQKVLNLNLVTDAGKISQLLETFADHFHTNISTGEMFQFYNLAKPTGGGSLLSLSLDPDTGLICPEILASTGAYILTPCSDKSETDVVNFFKNAFSIGKLAAEKSLVWLANSTGDQLAYNTALRQLTSAGLMVYQLAYNRDNLPDSLVYQVNPKPATAEFIKNELNATEVTLPPPGINADNKKVDVIVVLGQNAPRLAAPKFYIPPPARIPAATPASGTPISGTPTQPSTATAAKSSMLKSKH